MQFNRCLVHGETSSHNVITYNLNTNCKLQWLHWTSPSSSSRATVLEWVEAQMAPSQPVAMNSTLRIVEETRIPEKEVSVSQMDCFANKVGFFKIIFLKFLLISARRAFINDVMRFGDVFDLLTFITCKVGISIFRCFSFFFLSKQCWRGSTNV